MLYPGLDPPGKGKGKSKLRKKLSKLAREGGVKVKKVKARKNAKHKNKPFLGPEVSITEKPLEMAGIVGPVWKLMMSKGWATIIDDDVRRSFVSHLPTAFSPENQQKWWIKCRDTLPWRRPDVDGVPLNRMATWLVSPQRIQKETNSKFGPSVLQYKYGRTDWSPTPFPDWFHDLTQEVMALCGVSSSHLPDGCNCNWYRTGEDFVGWHADNEPIFDAYRNDTLIVSMSLGCARKFRVRPNDDVEKISEITLRGGDLCTMEGLFQKHYKHCVPKEINVSEERINLTWRWIRFSKRFMAEQHQRLEGEDGSVPIRGKPKQMPHSHLRPSSAADGSMAQEAQPPRPPDPVVHLHPTTSSKAPAAPVVIPPNVNVVAPGPVVMAPVVQ